MSKLNGKVAIVTGASKGIGAGIAESLATEGASVVVNYASDKAGADNTIAKITKSGGKAIAIQGQVGKTTDVARLFNETKKAFNGFDILVNNAGVYAFTPIAELAEVEVRRQFETNVFGLLFTTREAVRHFGEKGGSIINIGTFGTRLNVPASVTYTATKGAVDSITLVLANELGPKKIRVNSVNPGLVLTEGVSAGGLTAESEFVTGMIAKTPLGRVGTPQDIGDVVTFLATDEARWVTGQIIRVSGGLQ
jgi:3-oxoacyl-[acyl-carrier protein] reductase